ncbi:ATP-binding protein [Salipiger marinus]|uniref:ATP-binding protein n=1 Tax=Salipiger marinus TaxID=555512 RepID=UPI002C103C02|nr:ATP-binding protein [Salipiger manganoxidans]MEB3422199.1 ATP-binding protein [Salipiger manganoxidans]
MTNGPRLETIGDTGLLGYLPFEPDAAHLFFQLVSRRYERGALLVTSNRAVGE